MAVPAQQKPLQRCHATYLPIVDPDNVPRCFSPFVGPGLPMYMIRWVDKVTSRQQRQRRILIVTYQRLILLEGEGLIKRFTHTCLISEVLRKKGNGNTPGQMLLRIPKEYDILLEFCSDPRDLSLQPGQSERVADELAQCLDAIRQAQHRAWQGAGRPDPFPWGGIKPPPGNTADLIVLERRSKEEAMRDANVGYKTPEEKIRRRMQQQGLSPRSPPSSLSPRYQEPQNMLGPPVPQAPWSASAPADAVPSDRSGAASPAVGIMVQGQLMMQPDSDGAELQAEPMKELEACGCEECQKFMKVLRDEKQKVYLIAPLATLQLDTVEEQEHRILVVRENDLRVCDEQGHPFHTVPIASVERGWVRRDDSTFALWVRDGVPMLLQLATQSKAERFEQLLKRLHEDRGAGPLDIHPVKQIDHSFQQHLRAVSPKAAHAAAATAAAAAAAAPAPAAVPQQTAPRSTSAGQAELGATPPSMPPPSAGPSSAEAQELRSRLDHLERELQRQSELARVAQEAAKQAQSELREFRSLSASPQRDQQPPPPLPPQQPPPPLPAHTPPDGGARLAYSDPTVAAPEPQAADAAGDDSAPMPPPTWCFVEVPNPDQRHGHGGFAYKKRLIRVTEDGEFTVTTKRSQVCDRLHMNEVAKVARHTPETSPGPCSPLSGLGLGWHLRTKAGREIVFVTPTSLECHIWVRWLSTRFPHTSA
eukprot:TRINITY_DN12419_c0_g1_i1.p1 TRINITY_DN12419_c0_g1~~TRINITY_DN12419_c0_g1_i1.p1  ORF type:complete len:704 (+),score=197.50 TRINITY_DN12419_c0_g1_i1:121-2232(+)